MKVRFVKTLSAKAARQPDVKTFDGSLSMSLDQDGAKAFTAVVDPATKAVIDYRDVKIKGYLSTWGDPNNVDRQGEYVMPGAYTETLKQFMTNPIILAGHDNSPASAIGLFDVVREDAKGLYVEGHLSNAPDVQSIRVKVAEGILKTLSIGGRFYFAEDGRGIFKVLLREGSLVAVPANADALIQSNA